MTPINDRAVTPSDKGLERRKIQLIIYVLRSSMRKFGIVLLTDHL